MLVLTSVSSLTVSDGRKGHQPSWKSHVSKVNAFIISKTTFADVHARPKFVITPKDVVYVGIGDNMILPCQVYQ